jgi:AmmeMemoRadiSam system protein B
VLIDSDLTSELAKDSNIERDATAHRFEHSLEVQVPFLMRAQPKVRIAALCLSHLSYPMCERLAETIASATADPPALLVASSDMSHYLPAPLARQLDERALERALALDAKGLYEVVRRLGITMCGVIPATIMLLAARARGATKAELVRYGHSGETTGDDDRVVGYAAMTVQ